MPATQVGGSSPALCGQPLSAQGCEIPDSKCSPKALAGAAIRRGTQLRCRRASRQRLQPALVGFEVEGAERSTMQAILGLRTRARGHNASAAACCSPVRLKAATSAWLPPAVQVIFSSVWSGHEWTIDLAFCVEVLSGGVQCMQSVSQ